MARNDVKREYAHWLAIDRKTKVALRLPLTHAAFAEDKGVATRTLRRWREDPEFQALVEQRKVEAATEVMPNSTVVSRVGPPRAKADKRTRVEAPKGVTSADDPFNDPDLAPDEATYLRVKQALANMAGEGNQGAIDLFLKHYGKPFIEAEQADGTALAHLSDAELAAEVVALLGIERVAAALVDAGVE